MQLSFELWSSAAPTRHPVKVPNGHIHRHIYCEARQFVQSVSDKIPGFLFGIFRLFLNETDVGCLEGTLVTLHVRSTAFQ